MSGRTAVLDTIDELAQFTGISETDTLFYGVLIFGGANVQLHSWVGWQVYGTTVISHGKQQQAVADVRDSWQAGEAGVARPEGDVRAVLRIARFGADWEVPIIEGMSDDALAAGVGHFFDSADVGEVGNFALAGHRITNGEPFRDLPDLVEGDESIIETQLFDYTYVLDTDGDAVGSLSPTRGSSTIGPLT